MEPSLRVSPYTVHHSENLSWFMYEANHRQHSKCLVLMTTSSPLGIGIPMTLQPGVAKDIVLMVCNLSKCYFLNLSLFQSWSNTCVHWNTVSLCKDLNHRLSSCSVSICKYFMSGWLRTSLSRVFCFHPVFFKIYIYILVILGLHCYTWAVSGCSAQASHCSSFSCGRAQAVDCVGWVIVVHGLSCSIAYRIFLDQGSNLCPLHWQVDS